ncbi:DUF4352 domain-containing protein [Plantactinospora siamensis]|uniref:DUF4352 domain-containing protein n=1 Tax=Plantactinospora siamensis TaxID=555372 RepID=A0ABV6NRV9_9ACTN
MTTPEPADRGSPPNEPGPASGVGRSGTPAPEPGGTLSSEPGAPGVHPGAEPERAPLPADWSTPETVADAPPLGGVPEPQPGPSPEPAAGRAADPAAGRAAARSAAPPGRSGPRPWLILAVALLFLVCCYGGAAVAIFAWGRDALSAVRDRTEHAVRLGQPVRDGDLEFRVDRVRCGVSQVGDPIVNQTAVGQFCVVDLEVRNLSGGPVLLRDDRQQAYGRRDRRYPPDSDASILANIDQPVFLADIDPGQLVTGAIVYDLPANDRIVRLRLHGSASSKGALVRV